MMKIVLTLVVTLILGACASNKDFNVLADSATSFGFVETQTNVVKKEPLVQKPILQTPQPVVVFADPAGLDMDMADTDDMLALAYLDKSADWDLRAVVLSSGNVNWSSQQASIDALGLNTLVITPNRSGKSLAKAVSGAIGTGAVVMVLSPAQDFARVIKADNTILDRTAWVGMVGGRQLTDGVVEQFTTPNGKTVRDMNVAEDRQAWDFVIRSANTRSVEVKLAGWNATRHINQDLLVMPQVSPRVLGAVAHWKRQANFFWKIENIPPWDLAAIQIWEDPARFDVRKSAVRAGFVHNELGTGYAVGVTDLDNSSFVTNYHREQ